jgi:hypothetical protein
MPSLAAGGAVVDCSGHAELDGDDAARSTPLIVPTKPRTAASINRLTPVGTVLGQSGVIERTPNLGKTLQDVFTRPRWVTGNALAPTVTGSDKRVAEAPAANERPRHTHRVHTKALMSSRKAKPAEGGVT